MKHPILKYSDEDRFDIGSEVDANNTTDYVVPDGDLFMMGDNRDDSLDSRFQNALGFVPLENVGRPGAVHLLQLRCGVSVVADLALAG